MFVFWVLLSGYFDAFHIVTGILSSLLVAWLSHDLFFSEEEDLRTEVFRLGRFIKYLPWLFYEILRANLDVAYRTLHPRMPINPRLISFKFDVREERGVTTLANSITLTPGTVTVGVDEDGEFTVHALSEEAATDLLSGMMSRQVRAIRNPHV
jgi:multicomponent Na+:H+ antiporter subunit E